MVTQPPASSAPSKGEAKTLSWKYLFNNYFLLHDFFHKLTKVKASGPQFFDLQIDISMGMKSAVSTGGKLGVLGPFAGLFLYCLKGNSIRLRFIYGFLFVYWWNHFYTLGTYAGVFLKLPSVYSKTALFYEAHPQEKNLLRGLDSVMEQGQEYEDTSPILSKIYGQQDEEKNYVENEFFVKNKEKYLPEGVGQHWVNDKKLRYLDSFLTRYVYYSSTRWFSRLRQYLSFSVNSE